VGPEGSDTGRPCSTAQCHDLRVAHQAGSRLNGVHQTWGVLLTLIGKEQKLGTQCKASIHSQALILLNPHLIDLAPKGASHTVHHQRQPDPCPIRNEPGIVPRYS